MFKRTKCKLRARRVKSCYGSFRIEFIEKIDIELPETDLNHNILVFKKVKNTPEKYPRKAGKPAKSPIK